MPTKGPGHALQSLGGEQGQWALTGQGLHGRRGGCLWSPRPLSHVLGVHALSRHTARTRHHLQAKPNTQHPTYGSAPASRFGGGGRGEEGGPVHMTTSVSLRKERKAT